ncbi:type VI secretion system Vgr family protein [Paraburkholderia phytofirmans]|uniref:Type VI secretion system Vgr family protein n=1 Tax=Paraburkholderia phytofirmans (strain DSM 17436 / LMG 22146 / PsJN) TaxID=398527 RepID=B2T906_PARPJ|nr:type VI secretion system Vgr family protein [Paraburkholderia phytofirmans]ACD20908.1 type VI secretion system Vgr family protein [Paraburkholderia phytofirmans PsJN]
MTRWTAQTRTLTFSGAALPEIIGVDYRSRQCIEIREPMLTVRRLRGREAVGELFEYVVETEVENPDFLQDPESVAQLDLAAIVGTSGTVAIQVAGIGTFRAGAKGDTGRANVGADTRYINGEIVSARIRCVEDRAAVFEFVLRPFVWRATLNCDSRIFHGTVIEVLEEVLQPYVGTVEWRIGGMWPGKGYPPRDMIRQAWEPDWQFASFLMEEFGLFYWFEHRDDFHSLVISDLLSGFRPHGVAYETLRYHTGSRIDEEHISELSIAYTLTPGKATVNDHNYAEPRLAKSLVPNRETCEDTRGTASRDIEIYEPADFAQPEARRTAADANDERGEGQHLARVKLQSRRCQSLRATGRGRLQALQPGRTFTLAGYPQERANCEYIVLSCDLDMTEVGTSSGPTRQYTVNTEFELQPANEYFRLPQVTPRPRIDGYEYAVVVAPQDKEMYIDYRNRLRIQFDWDRQANLDGATSIWVRVMTQWQGGELGVVAPGRAGQMVLVSHVHGDPDRPVVAGFVVDKFNMPPWELPANAALSGMRSKSLGYGLRSNHLALDDTPGKMQAQLASDQANSRFVAGFNTRIDGTKGRTEARGEGIEIATDAHLVGRGNQGVLLTSEARVGASAPVKDMGETVARLTQARQQHEDLSRLAIQHNAQTMDASQGDATSMIKAQNEAIRGGQKTEENPSPEMTRPDVVLASAAGIATTAADSTHMASVKDHAITAGRDVSVSSGRSLFASVRGAISLFAYQLGLKLIAAKGKVDIQAQSDQMALAALNDLTISSTDGRIVLTAAKEIWLGAGGSYIQIDGSGIINGSPGAILERGATWDVPGPDTQRVRVPDLPGDKIHSAQFVVRDRSGNPLPNYPYQIKTENGPTWFGRTDEHGHTERVWTASPQDVAVYPAHEMDDADEEGAKDNCCDVKPSKYE